MNKIDFFFLERVVIGGPGMSQQIQKGVHNQTEIIYSVISNEGYFEYISSNCLKVLGYKQKELIGSNLSEYLHVEDINIFESFLYHGDDIFPCSFRFLQKNGSYIWMKTSVDVIYNHLNKDQREFVLKFAVTSADDKIDEVPKEVNPIRADGALDFVHELPCPLIISKKGKVQYANTAAVKLLVATSSEDIVGKMVFQFIDKMFHESVHETIENLHKGIDSGILEQIWTSLDGNKIYVELKSVLISYKGEQAELLVITDISSKKIYQSILQQSREKYQRLIQNSIDTIAVIHNDKWVFMNESGIKLFGAQDYPDVLGKSIYHFLHPEYHQHVKDQLDDITNGRTETIVTKQSWYTYSKKIVHTEMVCIPTTYFGEPAVQIILRDLSEHKHAEELMIRSEKLSVAGQLAAGIAHEIRNPLTAIKGFLQLMHGEIEKDNQYFEIIFSELNRIEMILSELLMLAKPQETVFEKANVKTILLEVVTLLETEAILRNIVIEKKFSDENQEVVCDKNQLKQVFINLIKNAIEAMPNGGTVTISTKSENFSIVIEIKDEGEGIPKELLERLGEPFLTTKEKGTGLGLMITYKIVENHKGTIDVSSSEKGTVFTIKLPKQKTVL